MLQQPNIQRMMQMRDQLRAGTAGLHQPTQPNRPRLPIERPNAVQPQTGQTDYQNALNSFSQQMSQQAPQQISQPEPSFTNMQPMFNNQIQSQMTNQSPSVPGMNQQLSNMARRMTPPPQDQPNEGVSAFIRNALQEGFDHSSILQFLSGRIGLQAPGAGRIGRPVEKNKQ